MNHIPLYKIPSNPYTNNQGLGFYRPISFTSRVRISFPNQTLEKEAFTRIKPKTLTFLAQSPFLVKLPIYHCFYFLRIHMNAISRNYMSKKPHSAQPKFLLNLAYNWYFLKVCNTKPKCLSCSNSLLEYTKIPSMKTMTIRSKYGRKTRFIKSLKAAGH